MTDVYLNLCSGQINTKSFFGPLEPSDTHTFVCFSFSFRVQTLIVGPDKVGLRWLETFNADVKHNLKTIHHWFVCSYAVQVFMCLIWIQPEEN